MTRRAVPDRLIRFVMLAALAGLGACSALPAPVPGGPADPAAVMRPDLLVADPSEPLPGQLVELTFPRETLRGIAFVLERQVGAGWQHDYDLVSDANGGEPLSWPHDAPPANFGVEDIGIGGPGPDRVAMPATAPPGAYRICTGNAGENFCVAIRIVAP